MRRSISVKHGVPKFINSSDVQIKVFTIKTTQVFFGNYVSTTYRMVYQLCTAGLRQNTPFHSIYFWLKLAVVYLLMDHLVLSNLKYFFFNAVKEPAVLRNILHYLLDKYRRFNDRKLCGKNSSNHRGQNIEFACRSSRSIKL